MSDIKTYLVATDADAQGAGTLRAFGAAAQGVNADEAVAVGAAIQGRRAVGRA